MSETPQVIGSYRITRRIARTDLSEVYAALNSASQPVCIKRLLPERAAADGEARLSFVREARLLAELSHPSIVKVHEIGDDGVAPFMCMELIDGQGLDALIRAQKPALLDGLELGRQIADALSRLHEKGVVHADLKPANVLVLPGPTAKLVDFGLAVSATGATKGVSGTPHYMSPEQTGLVDWPVDARSDIYALGVLLFEVLTGQVPFDADDPLALLKAHVSQTPRAPSTVTPGLPPLLDRLVLKLLQKNPSERYRSASSVAHDLGEVMSRLRRGDASPDFPLDTSLSANERVGHVFIGRGEELAQLEASLTRTADGHVQWFFVSGLAGTGKSALLKEFVCRSLAKGARFASGKCFAHAKGLPWYVLSEVLSHHVEHLQREPVAEREAAIARIRSAVGELAGELVKVVPAFASILPDAPPPTYLGEGKDRVRFMQMFTRLLEAIAPKGAPLVLMLDDLQWADHGTLQALESASMNVASASLLIVGSFRPEETPPEHPLTAILDKARTKAGFARVDLAPFTRDGTGLLVAETLRQARKAVPESLVDRIHSHTQGNALFVTEVLRALLGAGVLKVRGGALEV
ncbi:MAG: AAA family ATPase, partial [Archangium sp.]|nr:AAA family ATPase [Archangium sp.]